MHDLAVDVLSWKGAYDGRHFSNKVKAKFDGRIEQFVKAGVGRRLSDLLSHLPDSSVERIRTAPETVCRLFYSSQVEFVFFLNSAIAEARVLGNVTEGPENVWTALGDYCCSKEAVVPNLHTENGIPVDSNSPHAANAIGLSDLPYRSLASTELRQCLAKIGNALQIVQQISPGAYQLIADVTRVIVIRADQGSETFASYSHDPYAGRIALLNVQADSATESRLIDGLVHEAIHSFLYRLWTDVPYANQDRSELESVRFESPWSGRSLPLHSFFHACHVWFGLWQFWEAAVQSKAYSGSKARAMRDRAHTGFRHSSMPGKMARMSAYLVPDAQKVEQLWAIARNGS